MVDDLSVVAGRLARVPEFALQTGIGLALRALAVAGSAVRLGRTVFGGPAAAGPAPAGPAPAGPAPAGPAPAGPAPAYPDAPPAPGAASEPPGSMVSSRPAPEPVAGVALAIPDLDHLTVPSLRARLRSLTLDELHAIRAYEAAHAHRVPVLSAIDNRIRRIGTPGDEPAGTSG